MSDTLEILQLCSERLQRLDHKIDRIRLSVSEQSPAPPPPTPVPESAVVVGNIVTEIMESATGARAKAFEEVKDVLEDILMDVVIEVSDAEETDDITLEEIVSKKQITSNRKYVKTCDNCGYEVKASKK